MLKSKLLVSLLVVALLFAFTASTFAKDLPGDRAGRKADYLWKRIKLTDDQYVKVYQTLLDYEKKYDAMKLNKMAKPAKEEAIKKMQEGVYIDFGKIFTKDQSEKFGKYKANFFKKTYIKKKKRVIKTETTGENKEVKKEEKKDDKKK